MKNISVIGISHNRNGNALSDSSMNHLIKIINKFRAEGVCRVLFVMEGAYLGLVKNNDQRFQSLCGQIHPLFFYLVAQGIKIDFLYEDSRVKNNNTREAYEEQGRKISSLQKQLVLDTKISSMNQLESVVLNNIVSWSADGFNKKIARKITDSFIQADKGFVKSAKKYSSKYEHTIILVGGAHYLNIKKRYPNSFNYYLPGLKANEKKLNFLLRGYTVFYLMGTT
jgi:hypothetical protein